MSTSMHACNPYCGICKPPREALLECASCGGINDPELGEFGNCKECGSELSPRILPEPITFIAENNQSFPSSFHGIICVAKADTDDMIIV